ncbi:hypothetical protein D7X96_00565 [Corallococcus interemptor]|uniref:Uncharacterized protein n=1 Tax=Corallococcus interemptor TaxID=2316720 RepID=A0A3A8R294_9BACT|nr:hypothetical protein [Corallococcus interemptor]RKH74088.1 hypothetical protein D7X96_00565 [Corallococcus interemptor]
MRSLQALTVSAVLSFTVSCVTYPVITQADAPRAATVKPTPAKAAAHETSDREVLQGWSRMTSAKGRFSASFPAPLEVKEQTLKTDTGDVDVLSYIAPTKNKEGFVSIGVSQADDLTDGLSPDVALRSAVNLVLRNYNLTLLHAEPVTVNGARDSEDSFPGRDIEAVQASSGLRFSIRFILVHDRLYELIYMRHGEKTDPYQQLLSTFELQ